MSPFRRSEITRKVFTGKASRALHDLSSTSTIYMALIMHGRPLIFIYPKSQSVSLICHPQALMKRQHNKSTNWTTLIASRPRDTIIVAFSPLLFATHVPRLPWENDAITWALFNIVLYLLTPFFIFEILGHNLMSVRSGLPGKSSIYRYSLHFHFLRGAVRLVENGSQD
jgi:hypothetical protein